MSQLNYTIRKAKKIRKEKQNPIIWIGVHSRIEQIEDGYKKVFFDTPFGESELTSKLSIEDIIFEYELS